MKILDFQQVIHHLLSLQKKSPTVAVIVAFTGPEIKKTKNFIKLEYISYTMSLDCKKNQIVVPLKRDRTNSDDAERSSHPNSAVVPENIKERPQNGIARS